ncbi:MAG: hypothetical protein A4S09_09575 [Proteobacteria bacterium SG_bin7]|nr:MAG: hypothetical protein A4S09_09575 [Proteobacteria bacterium SG_bin7]
MTRSFWRLFYGSSFSRLGTSFSLVAIMSKFYDLSGSAQDWGILLSIRAIPFILFGLVSGLLVDRFHRKYVLIICDFTRVFIFLGLAFCTNLMWFYGLVFLGSLFTVPYDPCVKSLTVSWMERGELLKINSLAETARSLVSITGLALAGVLISAIGSKWCLIFDAFTYFVAALNILFLKGFEREESRASSFSTNAYWQNIKEGTTFIRSEKSVLYPIFVWTLMVFLIGFEGPMFFPLVTEKQWGGANIAGFIVACIASGSLITSLAIAHLKRLPIHSISATALVLLLDALALYFISQVNFVGSALAFASVLGVTETLFNTYAITEIQTKTPENMIGRVFSVISSLQEPLRVGAVFVAGVLIQNFAASKTLHAASLLEIGIAGLIFLFSLSRNFR